LYKSLVKQPQQKYGIIPYPSMLWEVKQVGLRS
jgi:hypothetical protein